MASSILEDIRTKFEDVELLEKGVTKCLLQKSNNPRDSVITDHKIKNLIEQVQNRSVDILMHYNDKDGQRRDELAILKGQKNTNPADNRIADVWSNFYDRLKDIKDYYKKHPNINQDPKSEEWFLNNVFEPPYQPPFFTGEENNGKFVDMHNLYQEFINLRKIKASGEYKIGDYLWYLANFDQFHEIPYSLKEKEYKKYKRYLKDLAEYLKDYFKRTQPLTDFATVESQHNQDFEYRWQEGTVRGWEKKDEPQDVESNPLYCQACKKLFTNPNTFVSHHSGKNHIKNAKELEKQVLAQGMKRGSTTTGPDNRTTSNEREKEQRKKLAFLESFIIRLKDILSDKIHDTMNQIRKKQSRTYEEMEAEAQHPAQIDEEKEAHDSDDDDEPIYNPKNLPLGWDGKPIPYWLYKLHGLGIEYKCEICGNYSYWGRRAFERHFQEWRHSYGMKCLRIPNTVHFKEITSINDALALHQKLMMDSEQYRFKPEIEEEFEDSAGNILNKKEYNDLKRQGLL